jgi:hypothetical protein
VANLPLVFHAEELRRPKRLFVKLDRVGGTLNN